MPTYLNRFKFGAVAGNGGQGAGSMANVEALTTAIGVRVAFLADGLKAASAALTAQTLGLITLGTNPTSGGYKLTIWVDVAANGDVRFRNITVNASGATMSTGFLAAASVSALANSDVCVLALLNDTAGAGRTMDLAINGTNVLTVNVANTIAMATTSGNSVPYLGRRVLGGAEVLPLASTMLAWSVETGAGWAGAGGAAYKAAVPTAADTASGLLHMWPKAGDGSGTTMNDVGTTNTTALTLTGVTWLSTFDNIVQANVSVAAGATSQLAPVAKLGTVAAGTQPTFTYAKQSGASSLTVSGSGLVTASGGAAGGDSAVIRITATDPGDGVSKYVDVTASVPAAAATFDSITVTPANPSLVAGGATQAMTATAKLGATTLGSQPTFAWSSSAPAVATVNASTGVVTPVGAGTTTITASATDPGDSVSKSGTTTVTVTASLTPQRLRTRRRH